MERKEVINEQELCERLEITRPTVRRMRQDGLPCLRAGGAWRYDWEKVLAWMESQAKEKLAAGKSA